MKTFILAMAMALCAGCSTVAGVGKDIQDGADWTKQKINGSKVQL